MPGPEDNPTDEISEEEFYRGVDAATGEGFFEEHQPEEGPPLTLKEAIDKARGGPPPTPFQGFA